MIKKSKLFKFMSVALVGCFLLTGCGEKKTASADNSGKEVIKVGTSGQYEPFTFMKDEKLTGFDIEVWEEIAKRCDYELEWVISDFKGMFGALDIGKIDAAAHQIDVTESRKAKYDFSETYAYNPLNFVVKEGSTVKSIADLEGKKVGVGVGGNDVEALKIADPEGKVEMVVLEGGDRWRMIEQGKIDAVFQAKPSALSAIRKGGYKVKVVEENPLYCETNAYPFNKEKKDVNKFNKVNDAIKAMHGDGTLTKISEKWFGGDITKK